MWTAAHALVSSRNRLGPMNFAKCFDVFHIFRKISATMLQCFSFFYELWFFFIFAVFSSLCQHRHISFEIKFRYLCVLHTKIKKTCTLHVRITLLKTICKIEKLQFLSEICYKMPLLALGFLVFLIIFLSQYDRKYKTDVLLLLGPKKLTIKKGKMKMHI